MAYFYFFFVSGIKIIPVAIFIIKQIVDFFCIRKWLDKINIMTFKRILRKSVYYWQDPSLRI